MKYKEKKICLLIFILTLFVGIAPLYAEIDDREFALQSTRPGEPRWDNVTGAPLLLSGPLLTYQSDLGYHTLCLGPKAPSLLLHIDEGAVVKIKGLGKNFHPSHLRVLLSSGSGGFTPGIVQLSADGKTLYISNQMPGPALVKIESSHDTSEPVHVGVFVSRWQTLPNMMQYDIPVEMSGDGLTAYFLTKEMPRRNVRETFYRLLPQKRMDMRVTGPTRLALTTRIPYEKRHRGAAFSYQIDVLLDAKPFTQADLTAWPDPSTLFNVGGRPHIFGTPEVFYLDIPEGGHTVSLTSSTMTLVNAYRPKNYVLELNKPVTVSQEASPSGESFVGGLLRAHKSVLQETLDQFDQHMPSHIQKASLRLGRDNSWRSGGGTGLYLLNFLSRKRPDNATLTHARDKTQRTDTFFRDLLPFSKDNNATQRFFWIHENELRSHQQVGFEHYALVCQQDGLLDSLKGGYFLALGDESAKTTYVLPARSAPSVLRLLLHKGALKSPTQVWVQFDDQPAQSLHLEPSIDTLPSHLYIPSKGTLGLKSLDLTFGDKAQDTTSGPFSLKKTSALTIEAASVNLALPKDVKHVRLWCQDASIEVALQYLAGRPFKLSPESLGDALEKVRTLHDPADLYIFGLKAYNNCVTSATDKKSCDVQSLLHALEAQGFSRALYADSLANLVNHWMDHYRVLIARHQVFFNHQKKPSPEYISPLKHKTAGRFDLMAYQDRAQDFMKKKDWTSAVEALSQVIKNADTTAWSKAHLDRIHALIKAGEIFLAQDALKSLVCYTKNPSLQRKASQALAASYVDTHNSFGLVGLLAHQLLYIEEKAPPHDSTQNNNDKYVSTLSKLADALIDDGKNILSQDLVSLKAQSNFWSEKSYSNFLKENAQNPVSIIFSNSNAQKDALLKGHLLQWQGLLDKALEAYGQGGDQGKIWQVYLQKARTIQTQLQSSDPQKRRAGAVAWQKWQNTYPGFFTWTQAHNLVSNYKKGISLYNDLRDTHELSYLAGKEAPLSLQIVGPQKLRFMVRPFLGPDQKQVLPQNWLMLTNGDKKNVFALNRTYPASELTAFGMPQTIGTATTIDYEVGPGTHDITLFVDKTDVLIQPFISAPVAPMSPLPPLNPATLTSALEGAWVPSLSENSTQPSDAYLLKDGTIDVDKEGTLINVSHKRAPPLLENQEIPQVFDDLPSQGAHRASALEAFELSVKNYEEVRTQANLTQAAKVWHEADQKSAMAPLWNRVTSLATWERLLPDASAGTHTLKTDQKPFIPDAPGLRIRRALMGETDIGDYIISGFSKLEFTIVNAQSVDIRIQATYETLITKDKVPLHLSYNLDGQKRPVKSYDKTDGSFVLNVPKGEHYLELSLDIPFADATARLKIFERKSKNDPWIPFVTQEEKVYHVATSTQPVVVRTQGPAWIRVDHENQGSTQSQDHFLKSGLQTLTLRPLKGENKTPYRIFKFTPRLVAENQVVLPPAPADATVSPIPIKVAHNQMPSVFEVKNGLCAHGQGDGTWSASTGWYRVNASDNLNPHPRSDTYAQQRLSYQYFDALNRRTWEAHTLVRERATGHTSLGAQGKLSYYPISVPVTLSIWSDVYTQKMGSNTNVAASLHLSGAHELDLTRNLRQKTTLSTYGSLIRFKQDNPLDIPDPDVFTPYKDTHRRGLDAQYKLTFEPSQDARLWGLVQETTNPNYNIISPDHLTLRAGYEQMVGPVTFGLEYGFKPYFADQDRLSNFNRTSFGGAISWDYWHDARNRFEFGAQFMQNIDTRVGTLPAGLSRTADRFWTGFFSLTWHFGQGRGYRDFKNTDGVFHKMRDRLVPASGNQVSYPGSP